MTTTIDLRTPSSPLCANSDVEIVNPQPSNSVNQESVSRDQGGDNHNEDDEEGEIEIISSTTVNANVQRTHTQVNCGLTEDSRVRATKGTTVDGEKDEMNN